MKPRRSHEKLKAMANGRSESLFRELLRKTVDAKASDLHIKTGLPPVVRLHDELRLLSRSLPPLTAVDILTICTEIVPPQLLAAFEQGREIDMAYSLSGVGRFRLNIFRHRGQIGIVCRFIPFEIANFEQLGLPSVLKKMALQTQGLILVTGSAGSGKSSTLAAILNESNSVRSGHIITIEDPVEYLIRDKKSVITQREVGLDTESFATGLKFALRQDPDVIMIGELRDRETIQTALNAAETGHLVLATLHTKDATESVQRITGVFGPENQREVRTQVSAALSAVISQKLLPRTPDAEGRVAGVVVATEIMINTPHIRDCLMDPNRTGEIREAIEKGGEYGMHSFDASLMSLFERGLITRETALANAGSRSDFELRLRGVQKSNDSWSSGSR